VGLSEADGLGGAGGGLAILSTRHCAMAETLSRVMLPDASRNGFLFFSAHFVSHLDGRGDGWI